MATTWLDFEASGWYRFAPFERSGEMVLSRDSNALLSSGASSQLVPAAPDPAVTDSELSFAISSALRRAITGKFFATLDADRQLRCDLTAVCQAAQGQNMRVEHLIIAFKDAWRRLPEARTLAQGSQGLDLLNRIISLCIAEYYSPSRAD